MEKRGGLEDVDQNEHHKKLLALFRESYDCFPALKLTSLIIYKQLELLLRRHCVSYRMKIIKTRKFGTVYIVQLL
mgnify:CR=1 FL=1